MIQLNTRNRVVLLNNMEKEHLLTEFLRNEMYSDISFMILTLDDCDFFDLFMFGNFLDVNTYRKISQEMFNYFKLLIDKEMYSEAIKIIYRMNFNTYINTYKNKSSDNFPVEDYIQSELIDSMLNYLYQLRLDDQLQLMLSDIYAHKDIPGSDIIREFMYNPELNIDYRTMEFCLNNEFINHDDFINNFYFLLDRYDDEYLTEILFRIFDNKDELLGYSMILFKKYLVEKRNDEYQLSLLIDYTVDQYRGFDFIRKVIQDKLLVDVETDFYYEFLDRGRNIFIKANDKRRSVMYEKLNDWYLTLLENNLIKPIFLKQQYVDKDSKFPLNHEDLLLLVSDTISFTYILDLDEFSLYEQIIRLINLSRFSFFQLRRKAGIESIINRNLSDYNQDVFMSFVRSDFLAFVLYL